MVNKKLTIGIDIDGVLTDFEDFVLKYGRKYFKRKPTNPNGFDVDYVFGATKKQTRKFWERYYVKYCITLPARPGAKKTIKRLKKEGHTIIIITGRKLSCEKGFLGAAMRYTVMLWLWKNGIPCNKIIFCPEHDLKVKICKNQSVDIMIEDKLQNVIAISKHIPVICINAKYNQGIASENITRVNSWSTIPQILKPKAAKFPS